MKYDFKSLEKVVKEKVSLKRFKHIMGVVEMATRLAKLNNADIEKCQIGSLLHDIAKEMDIDWMKKVCRENYMNDLTEEDLENNEILHGFVGAYYVNKEFGIEDSEVLNAIKYHTIGSKDMTLVEKIIYIADAIEYGRNYPSVIEIREVTLKNLNKGILMEIEHKEKYLESIGKKSHPNTSQLKENILTELSKTYL